LKTSLFAKNLLHAAEENADDRDRIMFNISYGIVITVQNTGPCASLRFDKTTEVFFSKSMRILSGQLK